jgi:hypothetical protein
MVMAMSIINVVAQQKLPRLCNYYIMTKLRINRTSSTAAPTLKFSVTCRRVVLDNCII